jgi:hypothetical protein
MLAAELIEKLPTCYGTLRIITVFTDLYPEPAKSSQRSCPLEYSLKLSHVYA